VSARELIAGKPADIAAIATTLAAAFQDDPALVWILRDPSKRKAKLQRFFRVAIREDLAAGLVLHSPGFEVVTLWRAPGRHKEEPLGSFRTLLTFASIFGLSLTRGSTVGGLMAKNHPTMRHWYLRYLGVHPDHQGKGWGGIAIRDGMVRADSDGLPIWLETCKPNNVSLYQRFGFVITEEWDVPNSGLHFWGMTKI
jgi:ribosomal protein S18 acetylase RimI-like enzyme